LLNPAVYAAHFKALAQLNEVAGLAGTAKYR
jgi:hypothetical protein